MPHPTPSSSSSFGLVVLALVLGLGGLIYAGGRSGAGASEPSPAADPSTVGLDRAEAPPSVETVLAPSACATAGYLCTGLAERDEPRVLRWDDERSVIRVGLPPPKGIGGARARELQAAAAAGILAWQGKPFRIQIDRNPTSTEVDFSVRWVATLEGAQLGRADTRWYRRADGRTGMQVGDFVLVYRDPFESGRALDVRKVQLAAAHEMGHALGLPHSDSDRDVMYPTNTARSLSARDYTTMAALYSLENGALLPAVSPP